MISLAYLFAFVLVLSIVVIVHEGGHFLMARLCGVQVEEFSLGFGKELWGRNDKKGTRWKVCLIPLGGYVKMLGDEDAASAQKSTKKLSEKELKKTFFMKPLWQRALIIFAGPATNYLLAFILLFGLFFGVGRLVVPPVIGEVMPDSAAQKAGIMVGDKIISINDRQVADFSDIGRIVRLVEYGKSLKINILRNDIQQELTVEPIWETKHQLPLLGVQSLVDNYQVEEKLGFIESVSLSAETLWNVTVDTLRYLGQIITGARVPRDLRGPLGIAEASGDALMGGWIVLIGFIANVSIAIGLMNLLPIPVLDGGHLMLYAVEAVRRKPLSEKIQNRLVYTGLSFLLVIFAYSMFLDVPRIIKRIFE
ncbi:MAG: RIP metalloprotease [Alphaproteobacteria bacterium]|nr:RIP metalloprotease [Alphaproteobacteria bacterium]